MGVDKEENKPIVKIHYEKNPQYRTVYVDGAIGGITPTNAINLNFYSTRHPIPKNVEFELREDGTLNKDGQPSLDSKTGIIREIEFGIYLNHDSATDLYEFLKRTLNK